MNIPSLRDLDLKGKTVLLRADLNVPAQRAKVTDSTRIDRLKPTIDYLVECGAKTLILSHFGRPEGEQNPDMSLAFLLAPLKESWGHEVRFARDCVGEDAERLANDLSDGEVGLLENVRFHKGEKSNDPAFVKQLAALGDVFVNDAFSAAHRSHASTEGLAHALPAAAGLLMEEELNALDAALGSPQKPVAAVAGGSKISSKISVLKNLAEKVDYLILGGGMANTFLYAGGANIGSSLCEKDMKDTANDITAFAKENDCEIILPVDCVCAAELSENAPSQTFDAQDIPEGQSAIDVGAASVKRITDLLTECKTIVWNGPLGVFEIKPFDAGTNALAAAVADMTKSGSIVSIAGGGDTVAALENAGTADDFTYISSAGGAFLEWLEGKTLPGIAALEKHKQAA